MKSVTTWISCAIFALACGYISQALFSVYNVNTMGPAYLEQPPTPIDSRGEDDFVNQDTDQNPISETSAKRAIISNGNEALSGQSAMANHDSLHLSATEIASLFETINNNPDLYRIAKAYAAIYSVSYTTLQSLFEQLIADTSETQYSKLMMVGNSITMRMYDLQAESTLRLLASFGKHNFTRNQLRSLLNRYAESNPLEAANWMVSQNYITVFRGNEFISNQVFFELAKYDLAYATSLLEQLHPQLQEEALSGITQVLETSEDFSTFLQNVRFTANKKLLETILRQWAITAPQDAAVALDTTYAKTPFQRARVSVLTSWQKESFEDASTWFLVSESEMSENRKIIYILNGAKYDEEPSSILDWIEAAPLKAKGAARDLALETLVGINPSFVIENLNKIQSEVKREKISVDIYEILMANQQIIEAEAFLNNSDFRERIIENAEVFTPPPAHINVMP
jgi:hypothetical protein